MANAVQDPPAGYDEQLDAARERLQDEQPEAPGEGAQPAEGQLSLGLGAELIDLSKFSVGGKKPQHGTLSITGVNGMELPDRKGLAKGSFVRLELIAQLDDVGDKDKVNRKEGIVVDTVRRHKGFMVDARLHGVVDSPRLEESDAEAALRRAVTALREQGVSDEGIKAVAGLA